MEEHPWDLGGGGEDKTSSPQPTLGVPRQGYASFQFTQGRPLSPGLGLGWGVQTSLTAHL